MSNYDEQSESTGRQKSVESESVSLKETDGSCFIVGAPIDEREDITQRGVRSLQSADLIVAADEQFAASLLKRVALSKPLLGINPDIEEDVRTTVLERLKNGQRIAFLTGKGFSIYPAMGRLINHIRENGLEPRVIPGVDIVSTALAMSGFEYETYFVAGMIPARRDARSEYIDMIASTDMTTIIQGGSTRFGASLRDLSEAFPDRYAAMILRPTVPGEVIRRGTLAELADGYSDRRFTGDFVIVLAETEHEADSDEETGSETAPVPQVSRENFNTEHLENDEEEYD